ncbi:MAG: anion transporter, partial [Proteobacteria bacterium]|nr:anion transporter [Pseudomonadota bacterium]
MFYKTDGFKLCVALLIGIIVFLLPRPEGSKFQISGDTNKLLLQSLAEHFTLVADGKAKKA